MSEKRHNKKKYPTVHTRIFLLGVLALRLFFSVMWRVIQRMRSTEELLHKYIDLGFRLSTGGMNYFELGSKLIRKVMKDNDVTSHEELISLAQEFDICLVSCGMSQELLGNSDHELMDSLDHGDVAMFLGDAFRARATLFI